MDLCVHCGDTATLKCEDCSQLLCKNCFTPSHREACAPNCFRGIPIKHTTSDNILKGFTQEWPDIYTLGVDQSFALTTKVRNIVHTHCLNGMPTIVFALLAYQLKHLHCKRLYVTMNEDMAWRIYSMIPLLPYYSPVKFTMDKESVEKFCGYSAIKSLRSIWCLGPGYDGKFLTNIRGSMERLMLRDIHIHAIHVLREQVLPPKRVEVHNIRFHVQHM